MTRVPYDQVDSIGYYEYEALLQIHKVEREEAERLAKEAEAKAKGV